VSQLANRLFGGAANQHVLGQAAGAIEDRQGEREGRIWALFQDGSRRLRWPPAAARIVQPLGRPRFLTPDSNPARTANFLEVGVATKLVATEQNFAALSRDYKTKADEVRGVQQFLNRELNNSIWEGKAASSFKDDWKKYDKVLDQLHTMLGALSKELHGRATWTGEFESRKGKG